MARRIYEFNRYLKAVCKINAETYRLDDRAIDFLIEIEAEDLINDDRTMSAKRWGTNDLRLFEV